MISEQEYNRRYNAIYGYFYRRISNRSIVEDLAADTLSEFYMSDKQIDNPKAFMFGIARNKLREYIRSKKRSTKTFDSLDDEGFDQKYGNDYSPEYEDRLEHLMRCIDKFTNDKDKQVIELCILGDFGRERVAKELDMTYAAVRKRLSRAVQKLKGNCADAWLRY